MNKTCMHSVADAPNHPECPGCSTVASYGIPWDPDPEPVNQWGVSVVLRGRCACGAMLIAGVCSVLGCFRENPRRRSEQGRSNILEPTGNEAAEREAMAVPARPGVWSNDYGADLRALTQEQTDMLIRSELVVTATAAERAEVRGAVGQPVAIEFIVASHVGPNAMGRTVLASRQRGGIDSDPLVRLLAFRAWGDRDRQWFEAYSPPRYSEGNSETEWFRKQMDLVRRAIMDRQRTKR